MIFGGGVLGVQSTLVERISCVLYECITCHLKKPMSYDLDRK